MFNFRKDIFRVLQEKKIVLKETLEIYHDVSLVLRRKVKEKKLTEIEAFPI